jgi:pantoate--beta-alanine ligase
LTPFTYCNNNRNLEILRTIPALNIWLSGVQSAGHSLAFVPTMGALHDGHASLVKRGRAKSDKVLVSIFVNPTQFNNARDLANYPRTEEHDLQVLQANDCDALFIPEVEEIYPSPRKEHWNFGPLSHSLEGHFRPGHFDGMLTVVKILLETVRPDIALFGEKDFQQLALIRAMVKKTGLSVIIEGCPTVRESDGLAMSSRNMRLSAAQRTQAIAISEVLLQLPQLKSAHLPGELRAWAWAQLGTAEGIIPEYLEIVNAETFEPLKAWSEALLAVVLVAVYVGDVRLIDNVKL